jgi:hypothetical protein
MIVLHCTLYYSSSSSESRPCFGHAYNCVVLQYSMVLVKDFPTPPSVLPVVNNDTMGLESCHAIQGSFVLLSKLTCCVYPVVLLIPWIFTYSYVCDVLFSTRFNNSWRMYTVWSKQQQQETFTSARTQSKGRLRMTSSVVRCTPSKREHKLGVSIAVSKYE